MNPKLFRSNQDYDALALEYRSASLERKSTICMEFQQNFSEWSTRILVAGMRDRSIPLSRQATAQDLLDSKVFHVSGYAKINGRWRPDGGRSFENFYKRAIILRCMDVLRSLASSGAPPEVALADDDILPARSSEPEEPDRSREEPARDLHRLLDALEKESGRGNPDLGRQARAVFEAIHKAYFEVGQMGEFTIHSLVAGGGEDGIERFRNDYHECAIELTSLENSMEAVCAEVQRLTLRERNLSADTGSDPSDSDNRNKLERTRNAILRRRRKLQFLRERHAKYRRASSNSEWVRSEEDVAKLYGMSQPTVHRRLEFARNFIRNHLQVE